MDERIWATTAVDLEQFHAYPGSATGALCDASQTLSLFYTNADPNPLAKLSPGDVQNLPFAAYQCVDCYTLWSAATEGDTMPKPDITTPAGQSIVDTVTANIERVRSLRGSGKASEAQELVGTTRPLIANLGGRGSLKARAELSSQLADAEASPLGGVVATSGASDYTVYAEVPALVARGAASAKEGLAIGVRMADIARDIAEVTVAMRLAIPGRGGLPDLDGQSGPYKAATNAIYTDLESGLADDDDQGRAVLASLKRAQQFQANKKIVDFLRALDSSAEEDVRSYFPQLPADVHSDFKRAVFALYEAEGIRLPAKALDDSEARSAEPRAVAVVTEARTTLDTVIKRASRFTPAERAKVQGDLTALAATLIAEAAKLGEVTKAERARERATEKVRAALVGVSLPKAEDVAAYREAAEAALQDSEDVSAYQLAKADWEALYGAATAA